MGDIPQQPTSTYFQPDLLYISAEGRPPLLWFLLQQKICFIGPFLEFCKPVQDHAKFGFRYRDVLLHRPYTALYSLILSNWSWSSATISLFLLQPVVALCESTQPPQLPWRLFVTIHFLVRGWQLLRQIPLRNSEL